MDTLGHVPVTDLNDDTGDYTIDKLDTEIADVIATGHYQETKKTIKFNYSLITKIITNLKGTMLSMLFIKIGLVMLYGIKRQVLCMT